MKNLLLIVFEGIADVFSWAAAVIMFGIFALVFLLVIFTVFTILITA